MATGGEINEGIGGTIDKLHEQLDSALGRTVDLHRTGANEEAVLAETAVAVGAAKALEILTGESWEGQIERREEEAAADAQDAVEPPGGSRRRRWRHKDAPG